MLVKIKPIERERWHGKTNNESFTQPIKLKALVNVKTGKYDTGLSDEDRKRLEKITGLDLSDIYNPIKPHPFWDTEAATLTLPNHTIILNTDNPLEEIKYHIAKASKFVANSLIEYENGNFPDAMFVIVNEEEEAKLKSKKAELRLQAFKKAEKLSLEEKQDLIIIITGKNLKKQSTDFISAELDKILVEKPEIFLEYVSKDKIYLSTYAMILEAVQKGVINKKGDTYYYMDFLLGSNINEAISFLSDIKNQGVKIAIIEKIE